MRILFVLPLLLAAALMSSACDSSQSNSNVKIAVADISRLMADSVPGKAGIKFLESRRAGFQKELDDIQEKLKSKEEQDDSAMGELQMSLSRSQQQLQAEGQNVAAILFETLQRVLDRFREAEGYTLILGQDTVASFAKAVDVTDAIMKELDKEAIDFTPLPPVAPSDIQIPASPSAETPPAGEGAGERAPSKE